MLRFYRLGRMLIRLQKESLRRWEQLPLDQAIEGGNETFAEAYRSDEPRRLMERFRQRHTSS